MAVVAVLLIAYSALVLVFLCAGFLVLVYKGFRYGSEIGPEIEANFEADDSFKRKRSRSSSIGIGYYDPASLATTDPIKQSIALICQHQDDESPLSVDEIYHNGHDNFY